MKDVRLKIREDVSHMMHQIENNDRQIYMIMIEASDSTTWMWAHLVSGPIKATANGAWKRTMAKIASSSPWTL
jgi:hypothetical protein